MSEYQKYSKAKFKTEFFRKRLKKTNGIFVQQIVLRQEACATCIPC